MSSVCSSVTSDPRSTPSSAMRHANTSTPGPAWLSCQIWVPVSAKRVSTERPKPWVCCKLQSSKAPAAELSCTRSVEPGATRTRGSSAERPRHRLERLRTFAAKGRVLMQLPHELLCFVGARLLQGLFNRAVRKEIAMQQQRLLSDEARQIGLPFGAHLSGSANLGSAPSELQE